MKDSLELISYYLEHNFSFEIIKSILDLPVQSLSELQSVLNIPIVSNFSIETNIIVYYKLSQLQNKLKEWFKKYWSYPLLLLIISGFLSYILGYILIPSLVELMIEFDSSVTYLFLFQYIAFIWITLTILFILTLLTTFVLLKTKLYGVLVAIFLSRFKITKKYLTLWFAQTMYEFLNQGIPFRSIFLILRKEAPNYYVKWLSYYPDTDLQEGIRFDNLYRQNMFDEKFKILMKNNEAQPNITHWLNTYVLFTTTEIEKNLKHLAIIFKTGIMAYLVILIGIFYNVMFIPMKIMEVL